MRVQIPFAVNPNSMQKLPKKFKFKKIHQNFKLLKKQKNSNIPSNLVFGNYGIVAKGNNFFTYNQIETIRRILVRYFKKFCKIWFNFSIVLPQTQKSQNSRMGKGAGKVKEWLAFIPSGSTFLELSFNPLVSKKDFFFIMRNLKKKLPCNVFISRRKLILKNYEFLKFDTN